MTADNYPGLPAVKTHPNIVGYAVHTLQPAGEPTTPENPANPNNQVQSNTSNRLPKTFNQKPFLENPVK